MVSLSKSTIMSYLYNPRFIVVTLLALFLSIHSDAAISSDQNDIIDETFDSNHQADNEGDPIGVDFPGEADNDDESPITVTPEALDFGSVTEGDSSTETLTVENTGNEDLEVEIRLEESDGDVFDITSGDGSFTLSPSHELDVEVEFAPGDADDFAGQLDIEHNADNEPDPVEVELTGTGAEDVDAPDVVELESPEDEAEQVARTPEFVWQEADEAGQYHLEVADDPNFSELLVDETTSDTSYTAEDDLEAEQTHYWRVRASNAGGDGDWSDIWSFTTEADLGTFALESPQDGAELTIDGTPEEEVTLTWEQPDSEVADELTYTWMLDGGGDFDEADLEFESDDNGQETSLTVTYQQLDDFLDNQGVAEDEAFTGSWSVVAEHDNGSQMADEPHDITLVRGEVTSSEEEVEVPDELTLEQNYPNPFNPSTQIRFEIPESGQVTLKVFNNLGQEVATLVDGQKSAGSHEVTFSADDLSSGNYIYRLEAGDQVKTRTMTFVK